MHSTVSYYQIYPRKLHYIVGLYIYKYITFPLLFDILSAPPGPNEYEKLGSCYISGLNR